MNGNTPEDGELVESAVVEDTDPPDNLPSEPGVVQDPHLGVEGEEEPLPEGDAENEEGTEL